MQESPRRTSLSNAPEYKKPFVAHTIFGTQIWPFREVAQTNDNGLGKKIVFEAAGQPHPDTDPMIVSVSYEEQYGLDVKRTAISRKYPRSEPRMQSTQIERKFEDFSISYNIGIDSPIVIEETYQDPRNFKAGIRVSTNCEGTMPLVVQMDYNPSKKIFLSAQFPYADYDAALKGDVEKRDKEGLYGPSYRNTYFQWEHLVGAKIGWTAYDDPERTYLLRHYKKLTTINNPKMTEIPNSPYRAKISRSEGRWDAGRLRFSRINSETGESWMFSAPETIDISDFQRRIQQESFQEFFYLYPAVFCVKNRGEERQWSSTWGKTDIAK